MSPSARHSVALGVLAMSRTVASPRRCSLVAVASPTPQMASTGSGCRNETTSEAGTRSMPSGLAWLEASLAMNLLGPMPTEQGTPCSSAICARRPAATSSGSPPSLRMAVVRSRKASSIEAISTRSVTVSKISSMPAETSP